MNILEQLAAHAAERVAEAKKTVSADEVIPMISRSSANAKKPLPPKE